MRLWLTSRLFSSHSTFFTLGISNKSEEGGPFYIKEKSLFIVIGGLFDRPVDSLPPTLTHLTLGLYFNQQITLLPPTLTHLTLGNHFNQLVDCLPANIQSLILDTRFNQPISHLPSSLAFLQIKNTSYKYSLETIPESTKFVMGYVGQFVIRDPSKDPNLLPPSQFV